MESDAGSKEFAVLVLIWFITDNSNHFNTFMANLLTDFFRRKRAVVRLTPCHSDSIVKQDFIGNIHLGGTGLPDG